MALWQRDRKVVCPFYRWAFKSLASTVRCIFALESLPLGGLRLSLGVLLGIPHLVARTSSSFVLPLIRQKIQDLLCLVNLELGLGQIRIVKDLTRVLPLSQSSLWLFTLIETVEELGRLPF